MFFYSKHLTVFTVETLSRCRWSPMPLYVSLWCRLLHHCDRLSSWCCEDKIHELIPQPVQQCCELCDVHATQRGTHGFLQRVGHNRVQEESFTPSIPLDLMVSNAGSDHLKCIAKLKGILKGVGGGGCDIYTTLVLRKCFNLYAIMCSFLQLHTIFPKAGLLERGDVCDVRTAEACYDDGPQQQGLSSLNVILCTCAWSSPCVNLAYLPLILV